MEEGTCATNPFVDFCLTDDIIRDKQIELINHIVLSYQKTEFSWRKKVFPSLNEAFNYLSNTNIDKHHFYEYIFTNKRRCVFDFDLEKSKNPELFNHILKTYDSLFEFGTTLQSFIFKSLSQLKELIDFKYHKHLPHNEKAVILCNSSTSEKISFHFIIRSFTLNFEDWKKLCLQIITKIPEYSEYFDKGIYKKTTLIRLLYSSKLGKNNRKILNRYKVQNNDDLKKTHLETTLVEAHTLNIPHIQLIENEPQPEEKRNTSKFESNELNEDKEKKIKFCLDNIDPSVEYDDWIRIGMIIKNELGDCGFELWDNWSSNSTKYDVREMEYKWNNLKDDGDLKMGSLVHMLDEEQKALFFQTFNTEEQLLSPRKVRLAPKNISYLPPDTLTFFDFYQKWNNKVVNENKDAEIEFTADLKKCIKMIINNSIKDINCFYFILDKTADGSFTWNLQTRIRDMTIKLAENVQLKNGSITKVEKIALENYIKNNSTRVVDTFEDFYFAPIDKESERLFNTCTGFRLTPSATVNMEDIKPILDHIRIVFADYDENSYHYIISWLACLVQRFKKIGTALVFQSDEQRTCGKSLFTEKFADVIFGKQYKMVFENVNDLTQQFNFYQKNVLLGFLEEATFAGDKKTANMLKKKITCSDQLFEVKRGAKIQAEDFMNLIINTNNHTPLSVEATDRRFAFFKCNECFKNDREYFVKLYKALTDDKVMSQFFRFLLDWDISQWDASKDIPETEYRMSLLNESKNPIYVWFEEELPQEHALMNVAKDNGGWIPIENMFIEYKHWCERHNYKNSYTTSNNFSKLIISKYKLETKRVWFNVNEYNQDTTNKTRKRALRINID